MIRKPPARRHAGQCGLASMSIFSDTEVAYLDSQKLGRLATVSAAGDRHVVPVAYRFDGDTGIFTIGGPFLVRSRKCRDIVADGRVAFVVDDVLPPWQPRGIEIRGLAELLPTGGREIEPHFAPESIRISPRWIVTWGIEPGDFGRGGRAVEGDRHTAAIDRGG